MYQCEPSQQYTLFFFVLHWWIGDHHLFTGLRELRKKARSVDPSLRGSLSNKSNFSKDCAQFLQRVEAKTYSFLTTWGTNKPHKTARSCHRAQHLFVGPSRAPPLSTPAAVGIQVMSQSAVQTTQPDRCTGSEVYLAFVP